MKKELEAFTGNSQLFIPLIFSFLTGRKARYKNAGITGIMKRIIIHHSWIVNVWYILVIISVPLVAVVQAYQNGGGLSG